MKPLHVLLAALWPLMAGAQEAPELVVFPADEIALDAQMFVTRPLLVFADSPNDPNFQRQMDLLARDPVSLANRDVVVVVDTDPAARSDWRQKFRPRGFSLVLLDKDLQPEIRKPLPWDVREITAAIDKFPLRRQEVLEQFPGR
ncbi:DUF4174 domain-containing protein [Gemmobacter nectariphilus]|uniref:DUF4174 domain-containing protein n=1 Tax=Gemmobacter nectariphilus TaxID=220343 RepID=UPI0003FC170B|nr:DUF4174 domain-containing protein [Gemmobacter nectariphilus]